MKFGFSVKKPLSLLSLSMLIVTMICTDSTWECQSRFLSNHAHLVEHSVSVVLFGYKVVNNNNNSKYNSVINSFTSEGVWWWNCAPMMTKRVLVVDMPSNPHSLIAECFLRTLLLNASWLLNVEVKTLTETFEMK